MQQYLNSEETTFDIVGIGRSTSQEIGYLLMRRPKPPKRPVISDDGALAIGGNITWFSIALIINSPSLDPDAVTALLGVQPTNIQRRGIPNVTPSGRTQRRVPEFGQWVLHLTPDDTDEWDVGEAVKILTERLPADLEIWRRLPTDAEAQLRFGLDIETFNQVFVLSPETARFAAERGVTLGFDIYASATGLPGSPVEIASAFFANMKPKS
jgi:hypothetical protein